jgi:hypothetical protein
MQLALRPYVTAGFALVGVSVIVAKRWQQRDKERAR